MKTGFSKREKILITIAALLIFAVVSVRFIITPLNGRYQATVEEYARVSAQKNLLDMTFANEANIRENNAAMQESYQELKQRFPLLMPNEEVDRLLTGLCLRHSLNPVMLDMSDPVSSKMVLLEGDGEAAGTLSPQAAAQADDATGANPGVFVLMQASMNLNGSAEALKGLIDTVEQMDYLRITRVSYSSERELDRINTPNISVAFEITMLDEAL